MVCTHKLRLLKGWLEKQDKSLSEKQPTLFKYFWLLHLHFRVLADF